MDEMWSFVHDKSQQYWLWWAIDHHNGVPLAYCFGTREHKNLDELCRLLAPFNIKTVYADNNYAYKSHIHESDVVTGKRNTQRIERKHLSLRTWCSRLVRKSIRFSKCHRMHRIVVSLVINCRFWGRPLPVHLLQDNTEATDLKKKTKERMLYLLRKASDKESLTAALENMRKKFGLSKSQCNNVLKKFRNLGISPITLPNSSNFDELRPLI